MSTNRIIIIGAGVIGLASARELALLGYDVVLFDKNAVGRGASHAAGGIVSPLRPWLAHTVVDRLAAASRQLYGDFVDQLTDETGIDTEYIKSGMLVVGDTHSAAATEWSTNSGNVVERVDRADLTRLVPDIGRVREGVYLPDIYQVRNPRLLQSLEIACTKMGISIHAGREVVSLLHTDSQVTGVKTNMGEFSADAVVIAAGAWSDTFSSSLGLRYNVTPVRGQMIWYQDSADRASRPILDDGEHYVVTRQDGVTLVGSTVENVGFDSGTTDKALIRLKNKAKNLILGLGELTPCGQWSGLRPGRAHGIPLVGAHPGIDGLFLNTGHFRNGVTLAPGSARLLADLITGKEQVGVGVSTL